MTLNPARMLAHTKARTIECRAVPGESLAAQGHQRLSLASRKQSPTASEPERPRPRALGIVAALLAVFNLCTPHRAAADEPEWKYSEGAHAAQAFFGGATFEASWGESNTITDANDQIPLGLDEDERTRGVIFGYKDKPLLKHIVGPLVRKRWSDSKYVPRKGSVANVMFWDAVKVDVTIGRQRLQEIETDAMGTERFDP